VRRKTCLALASLVLAAGAPVLAHHSFAAEFDATKAVRLTGTLTQIEWTNPHSYFYLDVKDEKGAMANWACEGAPPGAFSRRGFKKGDIKIGDTRRGWLPRQRWFATDGCKAGDTARRAKHLRRNSR
jgi:hypothetical protein